MDRRAFICRLVIGPLIPSLAAQAQQADRIYRLGVLAPGTPSGSITGLLQALPVEMRGLGYMEGRNLVIERRFGEDRPELLPRLAQELVQLNPNVILLIGSLALEAGKRATAKIPLVFITNIDPIAAGLVPSLSRPGGNVTGVLIAPDGTLAAKKLELVTQLVRHPTRVVMLVPDDPGIGMKLQVQELQRAAAALNMQTVVVQVRGGDYATAFAAVKEAQPGALVVGAHSRFLRDRREIIERAALQRLPAVYEWPQQVKDGGLMSYGASDSETYHRVAVYIDQILKGAKPGELPIEQPSKLILVINLNAAKRIGLTIPQSLLMRADEVIQ